MACCLFSCSNAARKVTGNVRKFFMNLKLMSILMCTWLCVVIFIMVEIGVFSNDNFVAFGPRKELSFMKVAIDTYYKYNMLIIMIVMHTFITDFIADSLSPHVLNVVQDTKSKYIPHKPFTYYSITTIWAVYCSISQLFAIFIAFAQIDLLIVRMLSDIVANLVTTSLYLQFKVHDPVKFQRHEDEKVQHIVTSLSPETSPSSTSLMMMAAAEHGREDVQMIVHDSYENSGNVSSNKADNNALSRLSLDSIVMSDRTSLLQHHKNNKYEEIVSSTASEINTSSSNNSNNNNKT
jgi:hypothetical protein